MSEPNKLRDHPRIAQLERMAALDPTIAADKSRETRADLIDQISMDVFGVTYDDIGFDEDDAAMSDADWEGFEMRYALAEGPDWEQVKAFRQLGWDVRDQHGRPLLVLHHFSWQLLAAIRGEFGAKLPGEISVSADAWGAAMEAEAKQFQSKSPKKR
ncbi:MAG: hypothetical protein ACREEB_07595 [Caulobacteraceae bacterium]